MHISDNIIVNEHIILLTILKQTSQATDQVTSASHKIYTAKNNIIYLPLMEQDSGTEKKQ